MLLLFLRSLRYRWIENVLAAVVVAVVLATLTAQRALSTSTLGQVHELAHKLGKNILADPAPGRHDSIPPMCLVRFEDNNPIKVRHEGIAVKKRSPG